MYELKLGYNTYRLCDDAEEAAQNIVDNMDEGYFEEMLDECYPEVEICNITFYPSEILKKADPIAYRCCMNDYYDSLLCDIVYDLERMDDGENETFYGIDVEYIEEDEEEDEEDEE